MDEPVPCCLQQQEKGDANANNEQQQQQQKNNNSFSHSQPLFKIEGACYGNNIKETTARIEKHVQERLTNSGKNISNINNPIFAANNFTSIPIRATNSFFNNDPMHGVYKYCVVMYRTLELTSTPLAANNENNENNENNHNNNNNNDDTQQQEQQHFQYQYSKLKFAYANENKVLTLTNIPKHLADNATLSIAQPLKLLGATYGYMPCLAQVQREQTNCRQESPTNNELHIKADNQTLTDLWPNVRKSFHLYYKFGSRGKVRTFICDETESVDIDYDEQLERDRELSNIPTLFALRPYYLQVHGAAYGLLDITEYMQKLILVDKQLSIKISRKELDEYYEQLQKARKVNPQLVPAVKRQLDSMWQRGFSLMYSVAPNFHEYKLLHCRENETITIPAPPVIDSASVATAKFRTSNNGVGDMWTIAKYGQYKDVCIVTCDVILYE